MQSPDRHPFLRHPHRSIIALALPAMLSLVAEPITGVVDTAFVKDLGAAPLAALGIGTLALSSIFWMFSFLAVGAQTGVAQALGDENPQRAREITSLSLILACGFSLLLVLLFVLGAEPITRLLGGEGEVLEQAVLYLRLRAFGGPPVLLMLVAFGVLRGLQDMRTPLWIAGGFNLLNILLDAPLIFGVGPIPALGVEGAALASTLSQWAGALWAMYILWRRVGFVWHIHGPDLRALLRVGGDLFIRTGLLTLFWLIGTRAANQISPEAGAAHQVIRTVWMFLALSMDGFATSVQSLVGYFLGAKRIAVARRAAALCTWWALGTGVVVTVIMLLATGLARRYMLPPEAAPYFDAAWLAAALMQPLAALAFATDGIHWGTGDFAYLRNGMILASGSVILLLLLLDPAMPGAFTWVWILTGLWMLLRSIVGLVRLWPGLGASPLRPATALAVD